MRLRASMIDSSRRALLALIVGALVALAAPGAAMAADKTPPVSKIDSVSAQPPYYVGAVVTWKVSASDSGADASGVAKIECRMMRFLSGGEPSFLFPGHGWTNCSTSVYTWQAQVQGSYMLQVRAIDIAGNVEVEDYPPDPANPCVACTINYKDGANFSFDVIPAPQGGTPQQPWDTEITGLTPDLDYGEAYLTDTPTPIVSFRRWESSSQFTTGDFECSVDFGSWVECDVPNFPGKWKFSPPLTGDGPHSIRVRALKNGLPDATPASLLFVLDTTPPETLITSGPNGDTVAPYYTTDNTPVFAYEAQEAYGVKWFECRVDGLDWFLCPKQDAKGSGAVTLARLAEGYHKFEVRATDRAGHTDATSALRVFYVNGPPETTITAGPGAVTSDTTPTFEFSSDESAATFECGFAGDSIVWEPCTSPWTSKPLALGTYEFLVRAVDEWGLIDSSPATYTVKITDGKADVSIDKTSNAPSSLKIGDVFSYSIAVTNNDADDTAHGVTVTDTLPNEVSFQSAVPNTCQHSGGKVTCALGDLAPNETKVVTITVKAMISGSFENFAVVDTSTDDTVPDNDEDGDGGVTVIKPDEPSTDGKADISIQKSAFPVGGVEAGDQVAYLIAVTNNDPDDDATNVKVEDDLPPQMQYVSASKGCQQANGHVTCNVGTLKPGQTKTVSITVKATVAGTFKNTAVVASDDDPTPGNNTDDDGGVKVTPTQPGTADGKADVAIVKTAAPDHTIEVGEQIVYTLAITNTDAADIATNVLVEDDLPSQVTYVSHDGASCQHANGHVSCTIGTLQPGQTVLVMITVTANVAGTFENIAAVSSSNDPTPGNDEDGDGGVTVVDPNNPGDDGKADVSIEKSALPPSGVEVGDQIVYTLAVTNHDAVQGATNVVVTDSLPNHVDYVSDNAGCQHANGVVACVVGNLDPGETKVIAITVKAKTAGTFTNTGSVTTGNDPTPGNNTDDDGGVTVTNPGPQDPPDGAADVEFHKSVAPSGTVSVGDQLVYTLSVTNKDDSDKATDVEINDDLPGEVGYVSSVGGCEHLAGHVKCPVGDLEPGASKVVTVTVTVVAAGTFENTAAVTSGNDPTPGNNQDGDGGVDANDGKADVKIVKTATPSDGIAVGQQVVYTLAVTNTDAADDAHNVVVTDDLPSQVTYVSSSQGCTHANRHVECNLGDLLPGKTKTVTITVKADVAGTFENIGAVSSSNDPSSGNNTDGDGGIKVVPNGPPNGDDKADVKIVKTAAPATGVAVGQQIVYTLAATNIDTTDVAHNVVVTDDLPSQVTYVSSSAGCTHANRHVVCNLGDIAPGKTETASITVKAAAAGTFENIGTVTASNDPSSGNNKDGDGGIKVVPSTPERSKFNADAACADGKLRLIDVLPTGKKVQIYGVAPPNSAGKVVSIFYRATGKRVAKVKVKPDLSFRKQIKAPKGKIARSSKARYQARLGTLRSEDLKLHRRFYVTKAKKGKKGTVVFAGKITKPLPAGGAKIRLRMSANCAKVAKAKVVATFKTKRSGAFRVSIKIPKNLRKAKAVYLRGDSKIRSMVGARASRKLFPTFSLPRGVRLK